MTRGKGLPGFWGCNYSPSAAALFFTHCVPHVTICRRSYSINYLIMTSLATVFEDVYGFSEGAVGLTYIRLGNGMIILSLSLLH